MPRTATPPHGRKAAIIVGINEYGTGAGLLPLRFAEADAHLMAACLDGLGYLTRLLIGHTATFAALKDLIVDGPFRDRPLDQLIFYFAGHGEQPNRNGEHILHMSGTSGSSDESPGTHRLAELVTRHMSARHVVMILDACRDDPSTQVQTRGRGTGSDERVAHAWQEVRDRASAQVSGVRDAPLFHALLSCSAGEVSCEDRWWEHGIFTKLLVDAIGTHGKQYPLDLLSRYVAQRTLERCHEKNYPRQRPQWIDTSIGERLFLHGPSPQELERLGKQLEANAKVFAALRPRLADALARRDWARIVAETALGMTVCDDPSDRSAMEGLHATAMNHLRRGTAAGPIDGAIPGSFILERAIPERAIADTRSHCGVSYVRIPAGTFEMGPPGAARRVSIAEPFWMSHVPISAEAFRRIRPSQKPEYPDHPHVYVSWNQAADYCRSVGGRLPTEAEWEYAARGGLEGCDFPWGAEATPLMMNVSSNGPRPADRYPPNGYGLVHMAGNVWEWCSDPFAPGSGQRAVRGGSWRETRLASCTVWSRKGKRPELGDIDIGFRCVLPDAFKR